MASRHRKPSGQRMQRRRDDRGGGEPYEDIIELQDELRRVRKDLNDRVEACKILKTNNNRLRDECRAFEKRTSDLESLEKASFVPGHTGNAAMRGVMAPPVVRALKKSVRSLNEKLSVRDRREQELNERNQELEVQLTDAERRLQVAESELRSISRMRTEAEEEVLKLKGEVQSAIGGKERAEIETRSVMERMEEDQQAARSVAESKSRRWPAHALRGWRTMWIREGPGQNARASGGGTGVDDAVDEQPPTSVVGDEPAADGAIDWEEASRCIVGDGTRVSCELRVHQGSMRMPLYKSAEAGGDDIGDGDAKTDVFTFVTIRFDGATNVQCTTSVRHLEGRGGPTEYASRFIYDLPVDRKLVERISRGRGRVHVDLFASEGPLGVVSEVTATGAARMLQVHAVELPTMDGTETVMVGGGVSGDGGSPSPSSTTTAVLLFEEDQGRSSDDKRGFVGMLNTLVAGLPRDCVAVDAMAMAGASRGSRLSSCLASGIFSDTGQRIGPEGSLVILRVHGASSSRTSPSVRNAWNREYDGIASALCVGSASVSLTVLLEGGQRRKRPRETPLRMASISSFANDSLDNTVNHGKNKDGTTSTTITAGHSDIVDTSAGKREGEERTSAVLCYSMWTHSSLVPICSLYEDLSAVAMDPVAIAAAQGLESADVGIGRQTEKVQSILQSLRRSLFEILRCAASKTCHTNEHDRATDDADHEDLRALRGVLGGLDRSIDEFVSTLYASVWTIAPNDQGSYDAGMLEHTLCLVVEFKDYFTQLLQRMLKDVQMISGPSASLSASIVNHFEGPTAGLSAPPTPTPTAGSSLVTGSSHPVRSAEDRTAPPPPPPLLPSCVELIEKCVAMAERRLDLLASSVASQVTSKTMEQRRCLEQSTGIVNEADDGTQSIVFMQEALKGVLGKLKASVLASVRGASQRERATGADANVHDHANANATDSMNAGHETIDAVMHRTAHEVLAGMHMSMPALVELLESLLDGDGNQEKEDLCEDDIDVYALRPVATFLKWLRNQHASIESAMVSIVGSEVLITSQSGLLQVFVKLSDIFILIEELFEDALVSALGAHRARRAATSLFQANLARMERDLRTTAARTHAIVSGFGREVPRSSEECVSLIMCHKRLQKRLVKRMARLARLSFSLHVDAALDYHQSHFGLALIHTAASDASAPGVVLLVRLLRLVGVRAHVLCSEIRKDNIESSNDSRQGGGRAGEVTHATKDASSYAGNGGSEEAVANHGRAIHVNDDGQHLVLTDARGRRLHDVSEVYRQCSAYMVMGKQRVGVAASIYTRLEEALRPSGLSEIPVTCAVGELKNGVHAKATDVLASVSASLVDAERFTRPQEGTTRRLQGACARFVQAVEECLSSETLDNGGGSEGDAGQLPAWLSGPPTTREHGLDLDEFAEAIDTLRSAVCKCLDDFKKTEAFVRSGMLMILNAETIWEETADPIRVKARREKLHNEAQSHGQDNATRDTSIESPHPSTTMGVPPSPSYIAGVESGVLQRPSRGIGKFSADHQSVSRDGDRDLPEPSTSPLPPPREAVLPRALGAPTQEIATSMLPRGPTDATDEHGDATGQFGRDFVGDGMLHSAHNAIFDASPAMTSSATIAPAAMAASNAAQMHEHMHKRALTDRLVQAGDEAPDARVDQSYLLRKAHEEYQELLQLQREREMEIEKLKMEKRQRRKKKRQQQRLVDSTSESDYSDFQSTTGTTPEGGNVRQSTPESASSAFRSTGAVGQSLTDASTLQDTKRSEHQEADGCTSTAMHHHAPHETGPSSLTPDATDSHVKTEVNALLPGGPHEVIADGPITDVSSAASATRPAVTSTVPIADASSGHVAAPSDAPAARRDEGKLADLMTVSESVTMLTSDFKTQKPLAATQEMAAQPQPRTKPKSDYYDVLPPDFDASDDDDDVARPLYDSHAEQRAQLSTLASSSRSRKPGATSSSSSSSSTSAMNKWRRAAASTAATAVKKEPSLLERMAMALKPDESDVHEVVGGSSSASSHEHIEAATPLYDSRAEKDEPVRPLYDSRAEKDEPVRPLYDSRAEKDEPVRPLYDSNAVLAQTSKPTGPGRGTSTAELIKSQPTTRPVRRLSWFGKSATSPISSTPIASSAAVASSSVPADAVTTPRGDAGSANYAAYSSESNQLEDDEECVRPITVSDAMANFPW